MADATEQAATQVRAEAALQFARTIPYWFLAIIGLIYASGFVVVTSYLERYGVRDLGTDVWKSRYIHIGVLSVVFPVMIIGTIYGLAYIYLLRKKEQAGLKEPEKQYSRPSLAFQSAVSGLVLLMLELAFYGFVLFARPSLARSSAEVIWELLGMMLVAFLGLILAARIERRWKKYRLTVFLAMVLRSAALVAVGWLLVKVAKPYWKLIAEMCRGRGHALALMTGFLLFIGYTLFALKMREAELSPARRRASWLVAICILGPMYFVSLLGFATSLFAYIPATRDGGDYTVSSLVTISLKTGCVLPRARLVEETSAALYVADESEDPGQWRRDLQAIPKLRAINRDQIAVIEYFPGTVEQTGGMPGTPRK